MPRIKQIGLLMLCCQLALSAFVVYWLIGEYKIEKTQLSKELNRQILDTRSQFMDSMLVSNVINPMFSENSKFKMHFNNPEIKKADSISVIIQDSSTDSLQFVLGEHKDDVLTEDFTLRIASDSSRELIVRTVKLVMNEVSTQESKFKLGEGQYPLDTIYLKQMLDSNLKKGGIQMKATWIFADSTHNGLHSRSGITVDSDILSNHVSVYFPKISNLILSKLIPEVLFSVLLLVVTAFSFWWAYRNLKQQYQLTQLQNAFIGNISHELKTPVSTVKLILEALADPTRDKSINTKEYLEIATKEASRLEHLVGSVLHTVSLNNATGNLKFKQEDLNAVVRHCVDIISLKEASAKITMDLPESAVKYEIDITHFQGVLMNMLENGIKYSIGPAQLHIQLVESKESIEILISDKGIGIPEEYLNKVFDKFFRVPTDNIHNVKGYGLGLNYAAEVIKQHGGKLSVKNNQNKGCTFTIRLDKSGN